MDMLEIGNAGLTEFEEQTHFSFWSALKSPLIIGANLATINSSSLDILLNQEIIALNQDDAGIAVDYEPTLSKEGSFQIWAGPLSSSSSKFVVLAFNEGNIIQDISFVLGNVARYNDYVNGSVSIKDVWNDRSLDARNGTIALSAVGVHETRVLVFSSQV